MVPGRGEPERYGPALSQNDSVVRIQLVDEGGLTAAFHIPGASHYH